MAMHDRADIVVIGAGMTGIACARALVAAGHNVRVLDKGRGIGGRMATRRVTLDGRDMTFDHGAQYLRPRATAFQQALVQAGAVPWGTDSDKLVGVPGMSALPKALAHGLHVTQQTEVTGLSHIDGQWHLTGPGLHATAARVILTIPAPQALRLLGAAHAFAPDLAGVVMDPCLTLMAAFDPGSPRPFTHRRDPDHPLAWIAQDSTKPARSPGMVTWVAQAGPELSAHLVDHDPDVSLARMLPLLCDVLGTTPAHLRYASVHRWRYAQTAQPLGTAFLHDAQRSLYVGGDWCLGPLAEHGWDSGRAIAADILGQDHVG